MLIRSLKVRSYRRWTREQEVEVMNDICHVAKPEVLSFVLNIILLFEY